MSKKVGDDVVQELARARERFPELAELLGFYERLWALIVTRRQQVEMDFGAPMANFDEEAWARQGKPALAFAWLALREEEFRPWCEQVVEVLRERFPELEVSATEPLIGLARRFYERGTAGRGVGVDALMLNALMPWLERASEALLPRLPVRRWQRGYCPVCGGFPDFAVVRSARTRTLLCGRCSARWPFPTNQCPFCGEQAPDQLGYYTDEHEVYRVDVCDSCGHYMKGVDGRRYQGVLRPEVERLLTPGLDLWAVQEGYTRPDGA
ncbi:MAG: formate dehydrogenase accessory protein FdhE [Ardenticatenia bacterium]|nr:formate dehydrogenase accessory protein FdhE [Ardenticatenia bacterium]